MKKKKKIIIAIVLLTLILLVVSGIVGYFKVIKPMFFSEEEEKGYEPLGEYDAHVLTDVYPTDIIWYGKQYEFKYKSNIRYETEYTDEVLKKRDGCSFVYIILNDRDGKLGITREELEKLLKLVDENSLYYFIYMGSAQHKVLEELLADEVGEFQFMGSVSVFHKDNSEIQIWLDGVPKSLDDDLVVYYAYLSLSMQFTDEVFKKD